MSLILVTGVNGFVGHHLARELVERGHGVVGAGHESTPSERLKELLNDYIVCDLTEPEQVARIPFEKLDAIINLAGLADIGRSFKDPDLYMRVNVGVLSVMCDEIKALGVRNIRIVAISSGAVYAAGQKMPLTELSKTDESSSPYSASKLAMEKFALNFRTEGYDCVIARPFNHIGPGQAGGFLLPDLYEKVVAAKTEVRVGNLDTKRDYTDVRDVVRAYISLATKDSLKHDLYNVCSGKARPGTEVLKTLKGALNRNELRTIVDEKLFRPSDSPVLYGDNSRLRQDTGWAPIIPFEESVKDFVDSKKNPNDT